jgi:hypothetical protein
MKYLQFCFALSILLLAAPLRCAELRSMRYTPRSAEETKRWQADLRAKLFKLLKLDDLVPQVRTIPFDAKEIKAWNMLGYRVQQLSIQSTPTRRIEVIVARPKDFGVQLPSNHSTPPQKIEVNVRPTQLKGPFPAVVCIGGHGSRMITPYTNGKEFGPFAADTKDSIYKGFGAELAKSGYVTISTCVSQHAIYENGRSLMGERLWDLMRAVSYLESLPEVDKTRIGCGGLSLGGEMTMWLAAMDTRIAAADSDGFLTVMDQMEHGHCMCWKVEGLRALVDYADIYALIAPRPLECQNGRKEGAHDFTPELARKAIAEVRLTYAAFGKECSATLDVHEGAHEVDLPAILAFFKNNLKPYARR